MCQAKWTQLATVHVIHPLVNLCLKPAGIDGPKCLKDNSNVNSSESLTVDEENVSAVIEERQVHIAANNTKKRHSWIKWEYYSSFPKLVRHISSIMKLKEKWIDLKRKDAQKIDIYWLLQTSRKLREKFINIHNLNRFQLNIATL